MTVCLQNFNDKFTTHLKILWVHAYTCINIKVLNRAIQSYQDLQKFPCKY